MSTYIGVYRFSYAYVCTGTHMCLCVCGSQRSVLAGVPQELSTWFIKKSPGWVDWLAPGILPSLPPQCWGCNPPHRDVWAENGTEVLMLTQRVLYTADTPAPTKELYRVAWAVPVLTRKTAFPFGYSDHKCWLPLHKAILRHLGLFISDSQLKWTLSAQATKQWSHKNCPNPTLSRIPPPGTCELTQMSRDFGRSCAKPHGDKEIMMSKATSYPESRTS